MAKQLVEMSQRSIASHRVTRYAMRKAHAVRDVSPAALFRSALRERSPALRCTHPSVQYLDDLDREFPFRLIIHHPVAPYAHTRISASE